MSDFIIGRVRRKLDEVRCWIGIVSGGRLSAMSIPIDGRFVMG